MIKRHQYHITDGKSPLSGKDTFNPIFTDLDVRLHKLEQLAVSWEHAVSELQNFGLERINKALVPLLEETRILMDELHRQHSEIRAQHTDLQEQMEDRIRAVDEWWARVRDEIPKVNSYKMFDCQDKDSVELDTVLFDTFFLDSIDGSLEVKLTGMVNGRTIVIFTDLADGGRLTLDPDFDWYPVDGEWPDLEHGHIHVFSVTAAALPRVVVSISPDHNAVATQEGQ